MCYCRSFYKRVTQRTNLLKSPSEESFAIGGKLFQINCFRAKQVDFNQVSYILLKTKSTSFTLNYVSATIFMSRISKNVSPPSILSLKCYSQMSVNLFII